MTQNNREEKTKAFLAKIRREIARWVVDENEAFDLSVSLVATDWKEIMLHDRNTRCMSCNCCNRPVLQKLIMNVTEQLIGWKDLYNTQVCASCEQDVKAGYHVRCSGCNVDFISYSYFYYDGDGKSKSHLEQKCSKCEKDRVQSELERTCYICHLKYIVEYGMDCLICPACMKKYNIDDRLYRKEYQKVNENNMRALRKGLSATLQLDQWIARVIEMNWTCQYCLTLPYEDIDHFIPLREGGDTSLNNCIPSCQSCNRRKSYIHPDKVTSIPKDAIDRVRRYLQQS